MDKSQFLKNWFKWINSRIIRIKRTKYSLTIENIELKTNLDNSQLLNTQLNKQIKDLRNQLNNFFKRWC